MVLRSSAVQGVLNGNILINILSKLVDLMVFVTSVKVSGLSTERRGPTKTKSTEKIIETKLTHGKRMVVIESSSHLMTSLSKDRLRRTLLVDLDFCSKVKRVRIQWTL